MTIILSSLLIIGAVIVSFYNFSERKEMTMDGFFLKKVFAMLIFFSSLTKFYLRVLKIPSLEKSFSKNLYSIFILSHSLTLAEKPLSLPSMDYFGNYAVHRPFSRCHLYLSCILSWWPQYTWNIMADLWFALCRWVPSALNDLIRKY